MIWRKHGLHGAKAIADRHMRACDRGTQLGCQRTQRCIVAR